MSDGLVFELYANLFTDKSYDKGQSKRLQILESSLEIISTKGLQELSFQSVGKACGMSPSHVAYYFSSRAVLIDMCCKYTVYALQAQINKRMKHAHTWQDRIKALVDANVYWAQMNRAHLSVWAAYKQGGVWIPTLKSFNQEFSKASKKRISAIIEPVYLNAKTVLLDRETLTLAIIAIIVGTYIDKNALQQKIDRKVRNQILKSIHALIAGAVKF